MTDMDIYGSGGEERTEKATPGRIKKAREQGYFAKSAELTAAVSVFGAVAVAALFGRHILKGLEDLVRTYIALSTSSSLADGAAYSAAACKFCGTALPLVAAVFALALAAELAQTGFRLRWKPVRFDANRLRRLGNGQKSASGILSALLKVAAVSIALVVGIKLHLNSTGKGFFVMTMLLCVASLLLVLSFFDYIVVLRLYARSLRMTRREVLEEMRQEGTDQTVKDRLYGQK